MAFDHLGYGFIGSGFVRWMKPFRRHAKLCAPGKKRREDGGHDLGGHHEHESIGHDHELAVGHDVGFAIGIVGADELVAQSDLCA